MKNHSIPNRKSSSSERMNNIRDQDGAKTQSRNSGQRRCDKESQLHQLPGDGG